MAKATVEDVLAKAKVPVRSVALCLDADLQAEHDELSAHLEVLRRESVSKMGQGSEAKEVADKIRHLEDEMRGSEVTFKFRGLTRRSLSRLQERFPAPDPNPQGLAWDVNKGAAALLAASAVEPVMTEEQAEQLLDTVSEGHASRMVGAAWLASTGSTQVPFSARASELTGNSGSN